MDYRDDDCALYVSPYSNPDEVLHASDDIQTFWSLLWQESNDEFDTMHQNDFDLAHLPRKMFHVWEGNHCLTAWWLLYCEVTTEDCRSALEIWATMTKAHDSFIKNIQSWKFE